MVLLLALAACLQDETEAWEYRPTIRVFVNVRTMEQRSPDELYAYGERLYNDGHFGRAVRVFAAFSETPGDELKPLRERGTFAVARCLFAAGDYQSAAAWFETFLSRHPDSELASGVYGARWFLFRSALEMARVGTRERVLGVAVYRSSKKGTDALRSALLRFPREPFTDDFYLALGDFYFEKGEFAEAQKEYELILTPGEYDKTNSAPRAQLRLATIFVKRFDSVDYDVKTLADAKREYEKFISSWSPARADAKRLEELDLTVESLGKMLDEAARGVLAINEKLAEKEWNVAGYYLWKGKPGAARVYLKALLTNYPKTSWAQKAREKLESLDK